MLTVAHFPKAQAEALGLQEAYLDRLRPIVVLAGSNGGGKSRYLSLVESIHGQAMTALRLKDEIRKAEAEYHDVVKRLTRGMQPQQRMSTAHYNLNEHRETMRSEADTQVSSVVPLSLEFDHSQILNPDDLTATERTNALSRLHGKIEGIFHVQWVYCDSVARALFRARHPDYTGHEVVVAGKDEAIRFNKILQQMLGGEIDVGLSPHTREPVPFLWGRPFDPNALSHGQRVLLTWSIFFAVGPRWPAKESFVVTLDEPESHLHPAAVIEVIGRLARVALRNRGQLWIATHSPTLVAHFYGGASIFHVHDHRIEYASPSKMKQLYCGLFGDADTHRRATDFMGEAEHAEFLHFAAGCLNDAMVADVSSDPQSRQLTSVITERLATGKRLRVLDYASGRGRFAAALSEVLGDRAPLLDYFTWDAEGTPEDVDVRHANVKQLYPASDPCRRCSSDISDYHNEGRVDLVVACNFLHEVPVRDWHRHFQAIGLALKPKGVLLVMEDLEMPVGELPHVGGFIVLDLPALRMLLGSTEGVVPHPTSDKRLEAIVVGRQALHEALKNGAAFDDRLLETLSDLHRRTLGRIEQLRQKRGGGERTHSVGREHARDAMQLANLTLAIHALAPASFGGRRPSRRRSPGR